MTARTELSKEGFFLGFLLDNFLDAKVLPIAPDRKQAVVLPGLAALR